MKMLKRILVLALCAALSVGVAGCGGGSGGNNVPAGKTELKIYYFYGGYGDKWLEDIITAYSAYNKNVVVNKKSYTGNTDPAQAIEGGSVAYDLYFLNSTGMNLASKNLLEDLTDVYEAQAPGGTEKVKEKMNNADYFDMTDVEIANGNYFALPWANGYCGLIYNKTTLDKTFGADNYSLPRTTDELAEFSDNLKTQGVVPFVWSAETEYWTFMFNIWWAQYEGYQGYEDYFNAVVRDGEGNPSLDMTGAVLSQQGRLESLKILEKFMKKDNAYSHPSCNVMDFMKAQNAFFGNGYAANDSLCAFMVNGDWADSEMKLAAATYNQDVRFMRAPIISALGTKLGLSETKLRKTVDYVDAVLDGETAEKPQGVTDSQIAAVKEARTIIYDLGRHMNIVLPKAAKNKEAAKDFLKFFASDAASGYYVRALSGLNLPYGYKPTAGETNTFSTFVKSLYEAYPEPLTVSYYKTTAMTFGANLYTHADDFESKLFLSGTAQQCFDNTVARYTTGRQGGWESMLREAGLID